MFAAQQSGVIGGGGREVVCSGAEEPGLQGVLTPTPPRPRPKPEAAEPLPSRDIPTRKHMHAHTSSSQCLRKLLHRVLQLTDAAVLDGKGLGQGESVQTQMQERMPSTACHLSPSVD
jgi:hypothetical protein